MPGPSYSRAARSKHRAARWLEYGLWIAGCLALGYCAFLWARAEYDQTEARWALDRLSSPREPSATSPREPSRAAEGSLVGSVEIPRLDLSAMVFEGTSDGTLARGVGHLTGSAGPGQPGNLVLAGHRDTFFRRLRGIREGDAITVRAPEGEFDYVVESTAIVTPDATEVLRAGDGATLTLITCYPFRFIGSAPDRFVVRARKVRTS